VVGWGKIHFSLAGRSEAGQGGVEGVGFLVSLVCWIGRRVNRK